MGMDKIKNNPFRILGVPSNASAKEIAANQSKLKAYLAASKTVSFPLDCVGGQSPLIRNTEFVGQATASINLPKEKLTHALFWFVKPEDPVGSMAWEYLVKSDEEKALELFSKRDTFAALVNRSVLAFITGDNIAAIICMGKMIQNDDMRTGFVNTVAGDTIQISKEELAETFFSKVFEEIDAFDVFQNVGDSIDFWVVENIRKYSIQKRFEIIENAISKARATKGDESKIWEEAGKELSNSTHRIRLRLIALVGANDVDYQRLADKLANQILQCSINYFNNSDESREYVLNAKKLAEYATKVAVGKLTKDRCEKAVETLTKKEKDLPPTGVEQEAIAIFKELKDFCEKPDKIEHSVTLLNNTKPKLQAMKAKLGVTNSYYLKLSSQVVNNALHNVIEEVNTSLEFAKQNSSLGIVGMDLIKSTVKTAWNTTLLMGQFDMDVALKERYKANRKTLKDLYNKTRGTSGFWDEGCIICIIQIIIYGIIGFCIATCN